MELQWWLGLTIYPMLTASGIWTCGVVPCPETWRIPSENGSVSTTSSRYHIPLQSVECIRHPCLTSYRFFPLYWVQYAYLCLCTQAKDTHLRWILSASQCPYFLSLSELGRLGRRNKVDYSTVYLRSKHDEVFWWGYFGATVDLDPLSAVYSIMTNRWIQKLIVITKSPPPRLFLSI